MENTPLCACVPVFTMKILWVLNSWAGSLRSAALWAEPGRGAVLPVCFPLTAACLLRRAGLTSGRAPSPTRPHRLLRREHGSWSGKPEQFRPFTGPFWPSASFSVSFGRCPSNLRQNAGPDTKLQPGVERPAAAGCGCLCRLSCRLGQRAPGPRAEDKGGGRHRGCWQVLSGDGSPLYRSLQWYL